MGGTHRFRRHNLVKYIFYSTILIVLVLTESAACDEVDNTVDEAPCQNEIDDDIQSTCNHKTQVTEMVFNYFKYRDNQIDRSKFKNLVANYCDKMLTETQCVLENVLPKISTACNSSAHYDGIMVQAKYHNIFAQYFCENNQQRFMDTVEEDGVNCLFNHNFATCFYASPSLAEQNFNSAHICGLLDTNINCEHHFGNCTNQYILNYRAELFRLLKVKFNCPS